MCARKPSAVPREKKQLREFKILTSVLVRTADVWPYEEDISRKIREISHAH